MSNNSKYCGLLSGENADDLFETLIIVTLIINALFRTCNNVTENSFVWRFILKFVDSNSGQYTSGSNIFLKVKFFFMVTFKN